MSAILSKIQQELKENNQVEWIEQHDRIYEESELTDKLKIENQYLFWKKNCDIRRALAEIEKTIKEAQKPSVRLAGWSEIARKAKCDRNTLKHSERFIWVNNEREKLLDMIQKQNNERPKLELVTNEEDEIMKLKKELALSKQESAKWFVKCEELEREIFLVKKALERQLLTNQNLKEQITQLKKK